MSTQRHPARPYIPICTLALVMALVPAGAMAIVNIEAQRQDNEGNGLHGRLDLTLSGDAGNSEHNQWRLGGRLLWQGPNRRQTLFIAHYAYGESRGTRNSNRAFVHLRHTWPLTSSTSGEVFAQIEQDEFARLEHRGLAGGGLRWTHGPKTIKQAFGLGIFRSRERFKDIGLGDRRSEQFWRANLYWHLQRPAGQGLTLSSTLYIQPRLGPMGDYRLLEELGCEVPLAQSIALRLELDIVHDSRPPLTVSETDFHYRTSFAYRF